MTTAVGATGGPEISVRIGAVKAPPIVPVLIGQQERFFAAQGLRADIVTFPDPATVRHALINRTVDVAVLSVGTTLLERDAKLRNLVLLQGRPNATIIARKELKMRAGDIRALRGKRIGVDASGGRTDLLLRLILFVNRIDANRDVTIIPTGDVPGQLDAMQAHRVDAQLTWEPGTSQLTLLSQLGLADVLLDLRASDTPYPVSRIVEGSVVALDEWVRVHRDAGLRVSRAVSCAERAMRTNPELVARAYRQNFPSLGPEVFENIAKFQPQVYWPRITKENIEALNYAYRQLGLLKRPVRFDDVVATGFPLSWWAQCP
jgi:ABC-type nitrate/sulfonate/bicarbonate transport system substrate-binding protein